VGSLRGTRRAVAFGPAAMIAADPAPPSPAGREPDR